MEYYDPQAAELLDYFAAKAMTAYIQRYSDGKNIASCSYDLAENMLRERALRRQEQRKNG